MITSKEITFTRFYINEFLQEVLNKIPENVSEVNAPHAQELIRHLTKQEDVTDGIELIAREQGSGELSIFLFDIVDRVEDYPPTIAYDALPDIVDDFVSGLDLMMEEEETVTAVEKVNLQFRNRTGEVVEEEVAEEVELAPEPVIEEPITEMPEEEVTITEESPVVPDFEPEAGEPEISFEQFFETEFMQNVSFRVDSDLDTDISSSVKSFSELIFENITTDFDSKISQSLVESILSLRTALPWRVGKTYSPSEMMKNEKELLDDYIAKLIQLSDQEPDMISNSMVQARIVLPEPTVPELVEEKQDKFVPEEPVKEFIKEEVPKEPTTIDGILSEYFQSEIEEHIRMVSECAEKLKEEPASNKLIKEMITTLQSFNEISMIHGYVLIESFCGHVIDIFLHGLKDKMQVDTQQISSFPEVFDILRQTDKLKDAKQNTEESEKLKDIVTILETSLFIPKSKESDKPKQKKETKSQSEPEEEKEISSDDKDALAGIIKDTLQDTKIIVTRELDSENTPIKCREILSKMKSAADVVALSNISQCVELLISAIDEKSGITNEQLKVIYTEFVESISTKMDPEDWKLKLGPKDTKKGDISSEDQSDLLNIIAEIEELNLSSFNAELTEIFEYKNQEACQKQVRYFKRLKSNLLLLGAVEKTALADYFISLFSDQENLPEASTDQLQEINQSYKIFIQSLRSESGAVNPEDLVEILKEMLAAEKVEPIVTEQKKTEDTDAAESEMSGIEDDILSKEDLIQETEEDKEEVTSDEEGDEDLAEIFKQEAESAVNQINDSIKILEKDVMNRQAYQNIERNIHSLKSSARLMGNNEVAELAAPLEDVCEKLASGSYQPNENHRDLVVGSVKALSGIINNEDIDNSEFIKKLENVEFPESAEEESAASDASHTGTESDKPLFSSDTDEDDDLLQIFKEESAEFIKLLNQASDDLEKNPKDQEAIKQLEHASHSLKSPAKMLGFSDIGQMGDAIENIAEASLKGELVLNKDMVKKVSDSIGYISELSEGKKLDPTAMSQIFSDLEIANISQISGEEAVTDEAGKNDINVFLSEAEELLGKINTDLLALEKNPDNKGLLDSVSRYLHTLKGSAQIMGQEKIGNLAHAIEDVFSQLKENNEKIPERTFDIVFRSVDGIQTMAHDIKVGKEESVNTYQELLSALKEEVILLKNDVTQTTLSTMRPVEIEKAPEMQKDAEKTIKITTDRLDNFVNMAAELVINKTQLADQLDKLKDIRKKIENDRERLKKTGNKIESVLGKKSADPDKESQEELVNNFEEILANLDDLSHRVSIITQNFDQNINQISHLSKTLHDDILQVRMVPTEVLFDRYPRAVRDMAKKQKKKINLLVEGEDTEMDRAMIESLTDPIMHLVRNAIDHGIELPKDRKSSDKNEDGIILLRARRDKNQVIVEIQDDGKGINIDDIKRAIVRKKLATKARVEKLTEDEILDYIFQPGFTTKRAASKVSGRGVGLDVVAEEIQKLKGDIRISSTPAKGTIFSIRLPLTLAITQALLVQMKGETLAIPLNSIEETLDFDKKKLITKDKQQYIKVRRSEVPVGFLSDFIKYESEVSAEEDTGNILIIQDGSVRYGIIVDRALRREEIVVRSLGEELADMDFVAGGTIFGDGSVVLIVDIPAITRKIEADYLDEQRDFSSLESARDILKGKSKKSVPKKKPAAQKKSTDKINKKKIEERKPSALIVDDSLSVRKFVSSVLERNNYSTMLAEDGPDALEELKTSQYDIIITDLEMPKMQGFELIEKIREQEHLKDVPIVILTGKAAKENKQQGLKLGANAYIVKPFKENDLLKTLEKFIQV